MGNEKFDSTKDYEESFTSVGTTLGKFKGSIAYSETCTAISFGVNVVGSPNLLPSWGVSKTYYQQLFSYSVPYEFEFVKEFSKTPYGKIDYVKLKSQN